MAPGAAEPALTGECGPMSAWRNQVVVPVHMAKVLTYPERVFAARAQIYS